mgnify:CR=1 FL=1
MKKNKLPNTLPTGYILLIIATFLWAAAGPVIKNTLEYIPSLTFLFLRFLIVCVVLLPYTVYEIQKVKIHHKDYFNLILLGVFSQTSLGLIFIGLKYTTATDNAIIGILGSILSVVAGHYFYNEKIHRDIKIGLLIASIGTLIVIVEPLFSPYQGINIMERVFGNTLILIYNFFWVTYIVWSKMSMGEKSKVLEKTLSFIKIKPMAKEYPPTLLTAISMYVGLFTIAPLAVFEMMGFFGNNQFFNVSQMGVEAIVGLLYMALLSSIVAYVSYQKAIQLVKVSDMAFFHYLSPLFTLPVAYVILGEIPNKFVVVGSIFIGIGVYIAEIKNNKY